MSGKSDRAFASSPDDLPADFGEGFRDFTMERIAELEAICQGQKAMLDELATAAGFGVGDSYSARAIIERLRTGKTTGQSGL